MVDTRNKPRKFSIFHLSNNVLMFLFMLIILFPLYYVFIISISDGNLVTMGKIKFWPVGLNIEAYKTILADQTIIRAYSNTFLYTGLGTFINLAMTALCAYPLARKYFFGRYLFTFMIVFTMFFDGGMIPNYMLVRELQMLNTIWAIVIPPAISVWYMVIMRTFFQNIPEEMHESAYMDGASDFKVFLKVVMPLSVPVFATIAMFYAVAHWNSFFPALIYLSDKAKYPMQIILRDFVIIGDIGKNARVTNSRDFIVSETNIKYAVIIITILPILTVYPFIQKYFVKGVMIGSLKG